MRVLVCLLIAGLAAGATAAADQGRGRGRGDDRGASVTAPNAPAQVNVVFSPKDLTIIRTHYGNRFKSLPPGLQKKLARGGSLPPGWEKKMEAFPASLIRDLPVLGENRRYGIYDGHAVIYNPISHAILDIVSLF